MPPSYYVNNKMRPLSLIVPAALKGSLDDAAITRRCTKRDLCEEALQNFLRAHARYDRRRQAIEAAGPERRRLRPIQYWPTLKPKTDGTATIHVWLSQDTAALVDEVQSQAGITFRAWCYSALKYNFDIGE
jgi:hypothetical protein